MSDEQVISQDDKQAPEAASVDKQNVDQVPYPRFKELVDEKNTLKDTNANLSVKIDEINKKIKFDSDEREQAELEKKGDYETVIADLKTKLESANTKAEAFDIYQEKERERLLSKLPEDDRDTYKDMVLSSLSAHVDKVSTRSTSVTSGRPGRGEYGGYETAVEHALKDPEGYKKSRESQQKNSIWGNLFSES